MKIYEFELTYKTIQGIPTDSIVNISEYTCKEKKDYYEVYDFKIYKDEINILNNGIMYCLTSDPSLFIKEYIKQTKNNIEHHENHLQRLNNTLSILENFKGE